MAEQVEKFDPSKLMDGVKDRIRATFVSLIPEEAWSAMVKTEIDKFFKESDGYNSYHTKDPKLSHFSAVVFGVLNEEATKKCKAILDSPDFYVRYNANNSTLSDILKEKLIERAPEIFISVLENSVAQAIQQMKNRAY